ncbi:hypothetical protein H0H92_003716 [Tricholoma furcatifolium]|nr:hypothetical protein H0H92_003716 [Tricholoma furcatifolium]
MFTVAKKQRSIERLKLPSSLANLNIDLGRIWLTRVPRKPTFLISRIDDESKYLEQKPRPKDRTPVFTRPPPGMVLKPTFLSTPDLFRPLSFSFALHPEPPKQEETSPAPIQLPKLLPFCLSLPGFDWDDQTTVLRSPMSGAVTSDKRRAGRGVKYLSPLARSPQNRGVRKAFILPLGRSSTPLSEGYDSDDLQDDQASSLCLFPQRDEASDIQAEDDWSDTDNLDVRLSETVDGTHHETVKDCLVWLDGELENLFHLNLVSTNKKTVDATRHKPVEDCFDWLDIELENLFHLDLPKSVNSNDVQGIRGDCFDWLDITEFEDLFTYPIDYVLLEYDAIRLWYWEALGASVSLARSFLHAQA